MTSKYVDNKQVRLNGGRMTIDQDDQERQNRP